MILIGMFDSPFVRRVAVSMELLGLPFEHRNWSVGAQQMEIRQYNPVGRVPVLVLDDGEVLVESAAILDHLDQVAGPARALLPVAGAERRQALKLMSLTMAGTEKGLQLMFERLFRPAEKRHQPWVDRCTGQMSGAIAEVEKHAARAGGGHLVGGRLTQADITLSCAFTYLCEAVGIDPAPYPAIAAHVARCEALPQFKVYKVPFFAPKV